MLRCAALCYTGRHDTTPLQVCILYSTDTVGGNSGSPVLDAHGRSEMRFAIGRYNVLQTTAAFTKHKKALLLCGLLRHIEDMHSKPSKLVRKIDSHKRESERARDRGREGVEGSSILDILLTTVASIHFLYFIL